MTFIDFLVGQRHIYVMTHDGFIQLLVTRHLFLIQSKNKETRMFYVSIVITFSIFLELLFNYTLLVFYKLNKFLPPRVNQFNIRALLVRMLKQVHIAKLNGIFWLV